MIKQYLKKMIVLKNTFNKIICSQKKILISHSLKYLFISIHFPYHLHKIIIILVCNKHLQNYLVVFNYFILSFFLNQKVDLL